MGLRGWSDLLPACFGCTARRSCVRLRSTMATEARAKPLVSVVEFSRDSNALMGLGTLAGVVCVCGVGRHGGERCVSGDEPPVAGVAPFGVEVR